MNDYEFAAVVHDGEYSTNCHVIRTKHTSEEQARRHIISDYLSRGRRIIKLERIHLTVPKIV